jgi:PAS domain S-box-containing protein
MTRSTDNQDWDALRAGVIGLGAHSARKSYYPELQQRLAELERFRALLDGSNDAIMLLRLPEGTVLDANRAAHELLGGELVGNELPETANPDFVHELLKGLSVDGGIRLEAEFGSPSAPYEIDAHTLAMRDGEFAVVVARDITDRRRAEESQRAHQRRLEAEVASRTEELRRSNEELVKATRAKDQFLASMSHELRTPLNSVIGFSDVMLRGLAGDVNEEQHRQLVMVNNAGKHLLALINQVLDLAKVESGEANVTIERFNACALLADVAELVRPQASERHLQLNVVCDPGSSEIESDRQRVMQILLNLAGNAVKFTPAGHVDLRLVCEAEDVVFRVIDTGPGVQPHEHIDIWQPFRQGTLEGAIKPSGTGLGLPISRELATLLGGSLTLEESSPSGSTFALRLPHACPRSAG